MKIIKEILNYRIDLPVWLLFLCFVVGRVLGDLIVGIIKCL